MTTPGLTLPFLWVCVAAPPPFCSVSLSVSSPAYFPSPSISSIPFDIISFFYLHVPTSP